RIPPSGAKLLITKGFLIPQGKQDGAHTLPVRHLGFGFHPGLVYSLAATGFMSKRPGGTIATQAKQLAAFAQCTSGSVEEGVEFMRAGRLQMKSQNAQPFFQRGNICNHEFDFDFVGHGNSWTFPITPHRHGEKEKSRGVEWGTYCRARIASGCAGIYNPGYLLAIRL